MSSGVSRDRYPPRVPQSARPSWEGRGDGADRRRADLRRFARFRRLFAAWKRDGLFLASPDAIADLPAYREIVGMGMDAVPLILNELVCEPDHWFVALGEITDQDPVPADAKGDMARMAEAWIGWGRSRGLVPE